MSPADHLPTWALALLGVGMTALSGGRAGIAALVWVSLVPWLLWMRRTTGWREPLWILGALVLGTVLQLSTIITPPISWLLAPMFAIPMAVSLWLLLLVAEHLRRRTSARMGMLGLGALAALADVSAGWGPAGAWGTAAAGLSDSLPILQLASLLGVGAIAFLVAWLSAWLAAMLAAPPSQRSALLPDGIALAAVLVAALGYGTWRLQQPSTAPTVSVAAVVTDLGLSPEGLPRPEALSAEVDALYARSALAASHGARLIVWNEGATAIWPAEEEAFLARGGDFARAHGVDLVLAYIVVTGEAPLAFENKAVFVGDSGDVLSSYRKRHPVPGETMPSANPVPRIERPYGVVSLAICYDHDYPEMSRGHARQGADLVALPSSDWAGIDPVHTRMARLRAIEGGFSTLRAARWAASAGFDAMGRVRGWMRADEDNAQVLLVDLPVQRIPTLYAAVGDGPILIAALLILLGWGGAAVRGRPRP